MAYVLMPHPKQQFFGSDGKPLAGGKVYTYSPGSSTLKASYTDSTGGTPNANPVILDAAGRASIWLNGYYKISLYNSLDVLQYTVDNVSGEPAPATSVYKYANEYGSINAAITAVGSASTNLIVSQNQTLTANLTIPENVNLNILKTGQITSGGYTLTINGPFEAGLYQVFSGFSAGDITFGTGSVSCVRPEWWGATGDGSTDDSTAMQCAFTSTAPVSLGPTTYNMGTTGLTITTSTKKIYGQGLKSVLLWADAFTGVGITVSNTHVQLRDFSVWKPFRGTTPANTVWAISNTSNTGLYDNISITSNGSNTYLGWYGGIKLAQWVHKIDRCRISSYTQALYALSANYVSMYQSNISSHDPLGYTVVIQGGSGHSISACDFEGETGYALFIGSAGTASGGSGPISVTGCYFESALLADIWIFGDVTYQASGIHIAGNFLSGGGVTKKGIVSDGVDGLTVVGNQIIGMVTNGIHLKTTAKNTYIKGNYNDSTEAGCVDLVNDATTFSGEIDSGSTLSTIQSGGRKYQYDIVTFGADDATPSVLGGRYFITANVNATNITALDDMNSGDIVTILAGDLLTTITAGGNWSINGNWDSSTDHSITIMKSGVTYYEISRG